mmetsp:Transcript_21917/g.47490  ORF Transcript_21917/g.47490 Transcript_21917/m.47490 type:complete len:218 (+) Transcript_21917:892-1545(+)
MKAGLSASSVSDKTSNSWSPPKISVRCTMLDRILSCRVIVGSSALRRTPPKSSGFMTGVGSSYEGDSSLVAVSASVFSTTTVSVSLGDSSLRPPRKKLDRSLRFLPFSYAPLGSDSSTLVAYSFFFVSISCCVSSSSLAFFFAVTIATVSSSYFFLKSSNDMEPLILLSESYASQAAASYGIARGLLLLVDASSPPFSLRTFSLDKAILSSIERQMS